MNKVKFMLLIIVLGALSMAFINEKSHVISKNKKQDMVKEYYQNLDKYKGDLSKNEVVHSSMTFEFAGNPGSIDIEVFNGPSMAYYQAFPDLTHTVKEIVVEGDQLACKVEAVGTHKGVFQGVEPTNKPIKVEAVSFFKVKGDKLISQYTCADILGLMMQIEAVKF